jgi:uncharacterized protein YdhG (YjbR/CyaY superfamily)
MNQPKPITTDDYIAAYPPDIQERLRAMRETIRTAAPDASEKISYGMPTFYYEGNLVYFGVSKNHIGFYPTPNGIEAFAQDLAPYKSSKGSVQFPHDQPLPLDLVAKITQYRLEQNRAEAAEKRKAR